MPGVSEADFQALQDEVRALRADMEGERPITDLKVQEQGEKMEGDREHIADLQAHVGRLRGLVDRKAYLGGMGLGKFGERVPKDKVWSCGQAAERTIGRADMEAIVEGVDLTGVEEVAFQTNQLSPEALPPLLHLLHQPHAGGVRRLCLCSNPGLLAGGLGSLGEGEGRGLPPTLTELSLWDCGLTRESLLALLRPGVLPPGLTYLHLGSTPALSEVGVMEALGAPEGGLPLSLATLRVPTAGPRRRGSLRCSGSVTSWISYD